MPYNRYCSVILDCKFIDVNMSGFRATKAGDAFQLEMKFEQVLLTDWIFICLRHLIFSIFIIMIMGIIIVLVFLFRLCLPFIPDSLILLLLVILLLICMIFSSSSYFSSISLKTELPTLLTLMRFIFFKEIRRGREAWNSAESHGLDQSSYDQRNTSVCKSIKIVALTTMTKLG